MSDAERAKAAYERWLDKGEGTLADLALAAEQTAALRAALTEYLDIESKAMSAVQCEAYGVPFTTEIADANTKLDGLRRNLRALLAAPEGQTKEEYEYVEGWGYLTKERARKGWPSGGQRAAEPRVQVNESDLAELVAAARFIHDHYKTGVGISGLCAALAPFETTPVEDEAEKRAAYVRALEAFYQHSLAYHAIVTAKETTWCGQTCPFALAVEAARR